MSQREWDPNTFELFAWFFALFLLVMFLEDAWGDPSQPNIEPATGYCVRPTPQGGC
jgi:hypothetical protein